MEKDEQHILDALLTGQEAAFRQLFDVYYSRLVIFARKYMEDIDSARDIVQDFFLWLYENRNSLSIHSSLQAYLYGSVRNRCLNQRKHLNVVDKHRETIRRAENGWDQEIEEEIDAAELEAKIFEIISNLPGQCRHIYLLSRIDGKRNREIADELKLSLRTVETQISKALKVLRDSLPDRKD